jgi:transcriptional regulator with XRE-family HTH domain
VEPKEQLGRNLRRLRTAAGLTQMELANRSEMDMAEISRLERGQRTPRLDTMVRVAEALDLTIEDLVAGIRGKA